LTFGAWSTCGQRATTDARIPAASSPGFRQQVLAARVVLERVGQAEMQHRCLHVVGGEQFGDAGTRTTRHDVVLDRDEAFVRLRQFEQQARDPAASRSAC
jgi:hypothetical protein